MSLRIRIPIRVVSEANQRGHWRVKHKRSSNQRFVVGCVLGPHPKPMLPCVVTLTRLAPRELDDDNNVGAFKAVRDEIALWLDVNDRSPLVSWRYGQEKSAEYGVRVTVVSAVDVVQP